MTGNSDLNNQDHGSVVGTPGGAGYVASSVVTLTAGMEPTTDGDGSNGNLTIDIGFYRLTLGETPARRVLAELTRFVVAREA